MPIISVRTVEHRQVLLGVFVPQVDGFEGWVASRG